MALNPICFVGSNADNDGDDAEDDCDKESPRESLAAQMIGAQVTQYKAAQIDLPKQVAYCWTLNGPVKRRLVLASPS